VIHTYYYYHKSKIALPPVHLFNLDEKAPANMYLGKGGKALYMANVTYLNYLPFFIFNGNWEREYNVFRRPV
jgi:hypothetical protein